MADTTLSDSDDGSPRMVTLYRGQKELSAIGAADADDAAKQAAIIVLQQKEGLRIGDEVKVSRILARCWWPPRSLWRPSSSWAPRCSLKGQRPNCGERVDGRVSLKESHRPPCS